MSSWIWMKDIDYAIVDKAIDPVNGYDDRASVPLLLLEHTCNIEAVKDQLKEDPLFDPSKHDDLWILRYLLSHKQKVKKAVAAAKHTLQFRKKHNLDARDIRNVVPHKIQSAADDQEFAGTISLRKSWLTRAPGNALVFTLPSEQRGVVGFLKFAGIKNDKATLNALSDDDLASVFIFLSEWAHQWLDYVTRTTGRLTKSIRFIDFTGASLFSNTREGIKRDGKVMDEMEDVYPQLLHAIFVYNAPSWIHAIWAIMRPIMPSRVLEKIDIIQPKTNEKERKRLLRFISLQQLPTSLGGSNEVEPFSW